MNDTEPSAIAPVKRPKQSPRTRPSLSTSSAYRQIDVTDTYNHVFRLCPYPDWHQCRLASDAVLTSYPLTSDLQTRLVPKVLELVHAPGCKLEALSSILLPTDSPETIESVLIEPLFQKTDAVLYTDGSTSAARGTAGWGVHVSFSRGPTHTIWGPVVTEPQDSQWLGAPNH